MQEQAKWQRVVGWILSGLIGAALIASAGMKLSAAAPVVEKFSEWGLTEWRVIIGVGELVSALLFLVPRTGVLGTLLLSSYLGGAIVTHMQHGEPIVAPSAFLVAMWVAAALRMPELRQRLAGG
jgi:hypothetical protein